MASENGKEGKRYLLIPFSPCLAPILVAELKKAKSTPVALSILSSLAEGADRIVAETILEIDGSTLKAVLPLTKEDYLNSFRTDEAKNEFERLLSFDYNPLFLRSRNLEDQYSTEDIPHWRKLSYFNSGKYIVDHCDVLIAIWNGEEAKGKGGTKEVIDYALLNNRPVIIISSIDPNAITIPPHSALDAKAIKQIEFFNSYLLDPEQERKYVDNCFKSYSLTTIEIRK